LKDNSWAKSYGNQILFLPGEREMNYPAAELRGIKMNFYLINPDAEHRGILLIKYKHPGFFVMPDLTVRVGLILSTKTVKLRTRMLK
jgi:hypothetical protein